MLTTKSLRKKYGSLEVLRGIDLEVKQGEVVAIVGASGAGKSTLLHILGGLDKADSGAVEIDGKDLTKLSTDQLADFRNQRIGFIFQFHNLLPEFSAWENVCLPALIKGEKPKETDRKAEKLLRMLGVFERKDHKPSQLSGGEAQRVAVARALINDPAIVFADEPSGNLDSKNAEDLHRLFFELRKELAQTFVLVTHSLALASMADRKIEIQDGKVFYQHQNQ